MLALPDLKTAVDLVRKRKGRTALTIYRLGGDEPQVIVDHNGDEELAVASSFKLYVLGTLVQEVASGRRKWDEIVHLDPTLASGGTGNMHGWPANTPVTLHTLATMMIAQSDNTATDHLLRTLGRRTVEEALVPMGCQHASRNIPVLSTLEAWKLKEFQMGRLADKYVSLDVDARRRYLADDVAKVRRTELATTAWRRPNRIDTVGWFASTRDLCAAMIWLRKNTEVGPAASARELLALRPLPGAVGLSFRYQGYKGGSEAGVLNYTFLLETHSGEWYAVSASWNNPHEVLDKSKFSGFVMRILQLLGG